MKNDISELSYKKLRSSDGNLPMAYALPKIHKEGTPFRIIISSLDSPLYSLASFLHEVISKNIDSLFSKIENSVQLVKKLKGTQVKKNFSLISLDVVSLFTNVPIELAIKSIEKRWNKIKNGISMPKVEFLRALTFVLDSTFFVFNEQYYQQKFGAPMGSPLSPIIADIVMQDLETEALDILGVPLPFYFRYVDDILTAVPIDSIDHVLTVFNSFHERLQFTLENGGDKINFLDLTLIKNKDRLEMDWYHKPTFSGRYLNFLSAHPLSQKRGQTGRKLNTRINEHRNSINWKTNTQSVITNHRLEVNHEFDWENIQILDKERNLSKRLISEKAHILMQKNGLNLRSDTDGLHHTYTTMLNELTN
ncbi:PREDICTED: uncharacterized protein LOC108759711 [Trachymyrmex cornetzi]|uniref:uncharacterized protein LOC108759711 n=1 Tax=Trachymyrmex cornetzi TaxID=471704 RepID=UPI00084EF550|nr:PREDICTED: uncharacterized protein LOC108759711 [Trachymyrmex cornetzi]